MTLSDDERCLPSGLTVVPQSDVSAAAALAEKPPTTRGLLFQRIISNHSRPFFKQTGTILSNSFEDSKFVKNRNSYPIEVLR
ncbi:hypothetical protein HZ326_24438 [Fusarium oxysporum f. sp. albedinis]|nr:hypothetical protein HZ326_24438 [Fusarium oxysporum f. sp. albedinis]